MSEQVLAYIIAVLIIAILGAIHKTISFIHYEKEIREYKSNQLLELRQELEQLKGEEE